MTFHIDRNRWHPPCDLQAFGPTSPGGVVTNPSFRPLTGPFDHRQQNHLRTGVSAAGRMWMKTGGMKIRLG